MNTLNIIRSPTKITPIYLKETREIFRGVFFQILCYQTEIEHINENKVDSTGSVFLIGIGPLTFNVKTFFPVFFPAIWDTIFHYSLQYNPSTVNSAPLP